MVCEAVQVHLCSSFHLEGGAIETQLQYLLLLQN